MIRHQPLCELPLMQAEAGAPPYFGCACIRLLKLLKISYLLSR